MPWKDLVNPGPMGSTGDVNGMTTRTVIPVSAYGAGVPATGTKIRITIGTFAGGLADKVYIGHAAASGDAYDFDGTQVQLSAFASTTWNISTFRIGNVADYAFDKTRPLVVAIHWSATSDANQPSGTGYISAVKAGDDASTTNVSGYGLAAANTAIGVIRVEVFTPEANWYPLHNTTLNSSTGTASTETLSQVTPVAAYDASVPATGTKLRVTIQGGNTSGATWDKMYVGHAAGSGDAWDFDGTQVQVTFGGNVTGSVGFPQALVTSDPVNYAFTKAKPLVVRLHASVASGVGSILGGPAAGFTSAGTLGDVTATTDVGGTVQANTIYAASMVEVYQVPGYWYDLYSKVLTSEAANFGGSTARMGIGTSVYNAGAPTTGTKLRATMQAGSSVGLSWDKAYIGHAAASGDSIDFDGTQVQLLWSGSASGSIAAGASLVSDGVDYAFNKTKNLVVTVHATGSAPTSYIAFEAGLAAGFARGTKSAADEAATTDVNTATYLTSTGSLFGFPKVEVFAAGPAATVSVQEVTMAAPDEICIEVRDAPITHGQIYNAGTNLATTATEAYSIANVSASPVDGSIRITTTANAFTTFYFDPGASGLIHVSGVVGVPNCNGTWNTTKISNTVVDLCATHFTGTWSAGTGKVWDYTLWTTYAPAGRRGWLCGVNADYFRSCDVEPAAYLNRVAATTPANWGTIGGQTVSAVYIKSKNYDHGYNDGAVLGRYCQTSALKHHLFLKLSGNLAQGGPYTISNGLAGISTSLTFNDRTTRACAINVNHTGYRTNDIGKIAYLSLWRPGAPNEGAYNFATAGFTQFEIINSANTTVAGPFSITLRCAATQPEERISIPIDNITSGYSSTDGLTGYNSTNPAKRFNILTWTVANPSVFTTSANHGWSVGQKLRLTDVGGETGPSTWNHTTIKIATVPAANQFTANWFEAGAWTGVIDGTAYPPYSAWTARGKTGYVVALTDSNRAGTHVYGMEFGAYTSAPSGDYRIRIAGLGTSDPFPIKSTAWYDVAKQMAAGEYHHRWGIDLDGRFGYTRPKNFIDGVVNGGNQNKIYQNKLPYPMGWGGNLYGFAKAINGAAVARPPWFFPTGTPDTWYQSGYGAGGGSWADAGDWVTRMLEIGRSVYCFCELVLLRPTAASKSLNLPTLASMFPTVTEYTGTDGLPHMFTQAVFGMEGYRRMQHGVGSFLPEGAVPGGMTTDTDTGTTTTPSYITPSVTYANAPDHWTNYFYAFCAAKIAQVFAAYGFTAASNLWKNSALKAFAWSESMFRNTTALDAYYQGVLQLETLMANPVFSLYGAWTHADYVFNRDFIDSDNCAGIARTCAAASLLRLTGNTAAYKPILDADLGVGASVWFEVLGHRCLAGWEYYQTAGTSAATRTQIANTILDIKVRTTASLELFDPTPPKQTCRMMMFTDANMFNIGTIGTDLQSQAWPYIASHIISGDARYLQTLQDGMAFIYGANPSGMSTVAQVGRRWPGTIFNADNLYSGAECAKGIGCYMWQFIGQFLYGFGAWSYASNGGSIEGPDPNYIAEHINERETYPNRYATPIYEAVWESHYQLGEMERAVQQDVFPLQQIAFYLDSWDEAGGGTPPETAAYSVSRPRIRIR